MLLLPLGPKGKLPELPIMSIMVGLCTILFSIYSFRSLDQAITRSMKNESYRVVHDQAEQFTSKWCETEKISTAGCSFLKNRLVGVTLLSKTDFIETTRSDIKNVKNIAAGSDSFFQKENNNIDSFAEQLFQKISSLEEWSIWRRSVEDNYRNGNWLTSKTVSSASVIKAQFTHGGWLHLIGNMIFFFAFAGVLEVRFGILIWSVVYFVGGATGLVLQASSALPEGVPLVGASAGISALAGAYLVLLWKHPTRVLLSLIVYNRIIMIPTFAFVICLLVAQDLAGTIASHGPVAHLAHLSSLVFGAVCAVIFKFVAQQDLAFLYPQEQQLFEEAHGSKDALSIYDQILVWNPDNVIVRDLAFAEANKDQIPSKARLAFYKFHLDEYLTQLRREKDYDQVVALGATLSRLTEFKELTKLLSVSQCLFIIRTLLQLDSSPIAEDWVHVVLETQPKARLNAEFRNLASQFTRKKSEGAVSA